MNNCKPEIAGVIDDSESGFSLVENRESRFTDSEANLKKTESSEDTVRRLLVNYDIGQSFANLDCERRSP